MTKAEMLRFLEPFDADVVLRIWNGHVWTRVSAKAEFSERLAETCR